MSRCPHADVCPRYGRHCQSVDAGKTGESLMAAEWVFPGRWPQPQRAQTLLSGGLGFLGRGGARLGNRRLRCPGGGRRYASSCRPLGGGGSPLWRPPHPALRLSLGIAGRHELAADGSLDQPSQEALGVSHRATAHAPCRLIENRLLGVRSEERRVGKEWPEQWKREHERRKDR